MKKMSQQEIREAVAEMIQMFWAMRANGEIISKEMEMEYKALLNKVKSI
ncbi:hypothetical protein [Bacillus sp. AFS073361]|nr:hypothetical protein [Bacillus sp. AFS073361]